MVIEGFLLHLKAEIIKEVHKDGYSVVAFSTIKKAGDYSSDRFINGIKKGNVNFKAKVNHNLQLITFSK